MALLVMGAAVFAGLRGMQPPTPVPADAPATEFSAERAQRHLRAITRAPHPVGTAEHARVRAYLVVELRALGLEVHVQTTTAARSEGVGVIAGTVYNIVARRPGKGSSSPAVLLMAHYDAVPHSFGAADDGAGVAAILEALRALNAGTPLRNDVMVLFSDAEEMGLLGAQAFVDEHSWARDVGVVLNFEGRGHTGPVTLFETSPGNGWLIEEFARAAPHAQASSLSYEVYRRMPNDTDLSVFQQAEVPGLNFAFVGGHTHYHTPLDRYEEMDPASLQHHGSYVLSLARRFGNVDLSRTPASDRVYFDLPALGLVDYPAGWALPLAVLTLLAGVAVVAVGVGRGVLRWRGMALGLPALTLALGVAAALALGGWSAVEALHPQYGWILQGDTYNSLYYLVGFSALVAAGTLAIYVLFRRWAEPAELAVPPLLAWLGLSLATALWVPGASYIFTWPALFAVAALGVGVGRAAAVALLAVPALLLLPPLIYQLQVTLTLDALVIPMLVLSLLLALLVLPLGLVTGHWPRAVPALLLALGAGALLGGARTAGFTAEHKRPDSILYLLDADRQEALWVSFDPAPDDWTGQFLGDDPTRAPLGRYRLGYGSAPEPLQAAAQVLPLPPLELEVLSETPTPEGRRLRLRVRSPRGAQRISLYAKPPVAPISDVSINGRPVRSGGDLSIAANGHLLTYYAAPAEGIVLEFTLHSRDPLVLRTAETSFGLPELPRQHIGPRPADAMSKPFVSTDMTIVQRTYRF